MCGLRYGSSDAVTATDAWLGTIQRAAYLASTALADEKGAFPLFDRDKYLAGATVAGLDPGNPRRHRRTRHPQCASDLGGADRHDLRSLPTTCRPGWSRCSASATRATS